MISFEDAINVTKDKDRALLIGNGFSAKYFSYGNLLEKSGIEDDSAVGSLFTALNTVDFEAVVRALEGASIVESSYGNQNHADELEADAQSVRESLVIAVNETHPNHREELELSYDSSASFLAHFGKVFTLNYDLLLYWVNLEYRSLKDGFGLADDSADGRFRVSFKENAYCSMYNLHGGLHLFQSPVGDVVKAQNTGDGVIATITKTITEDKQLPLYVAEGTSIKKMRKINSVGYLRHCYEQLRENSSCVFVYGHSADDNDAHIYRALFSSDIEQIYFGVYQPDPEKLKLLDAQLAKYKILGGKNIDYTFYDSETAHIWDAP